MELERRKRRFALDFVLWDSARVWTKLPKKYRESKDFILAALKSPSLPSEIDFERAFPKSLWPWWKDRDIVLGFFARPDFSELYNSRLLFAPNRHQGDRQVMLEYCSKIPRSLQHCNEELRNDRQVVEAAITRDGMELKYASLRLRGDRDLVTKACQNNGRALDICPEGNVRTQLTSDRDFMLKVLVKDGGSIFRLLPQELKQDKQLLLVALAHGMMFRDVPRDYQTSKDFLVEALKQKSSIYLKIDETLQFDEDLAFATIIAKDSTVDIHQLVLNNCPQLKNNRDVVMAIAKRGKRDMLQQILTTSINDNKNNNQFAQDKELMMAAVQRDGNLFNYTHTNLRQDEELILASIEERSIRGTFSRLPLETWKLYPSISIKVMQVLSQCRLQPINSFLMVGRLDFWRKLPQENWTNRNFVIAWIKLGWAIENIFSHLVVNNEELALLIAKHNWIEFEKISPALRGNSDFMSRAVQQDGRVLRFASQEAQDNFNIQVHAFANHPDAFIGIRPTNNSSTQTTNYVTSFRLRVKQILDLRLKFVYDFLRGIQTLETNYESPTANSSPLSLLNLDPETSQVHKKSIAEYLGVPMGKDLKALRLAWYNLEYQHANNDYNNNPYNNIA